MKYGYRSFVLPVDEKYIVYIDAVATFPMQLQNVKQYENENTFSVRSENWTMSRK